MLIYNQHDCCASLPFEIVFYSGQDTDSEEVRWGLAVHSHHLQE